MKILIAGFLLTAFCVAVAVLAVLLVGVLIRITGIDDDNDE